MNWWNWNFRNFVSAGLGFSGFDDAFVTPGLHFPKFDDCFVSVGFQVLALF